MEFMLLRVSLMRELTVYLLMCLDRSLRLMMFLQAAISNGAVLPMYDPEKHPALDDGVYT